MAVTVGICFHDHKRRIPISFVHPMHFALLATSVHFFFICFIVFFFVPTALTFSVLYAYDFPFMSEPNSSVLCPSTQFTRTSTSSLSNDIRRYSFFTHAKTISIGVE